MGTMRGHCHSPLLKAASFYAGSDQTLGQFLVEKCHYSQLRCDTDNPNSKCKRKLKRHVIGYTRAGSSIIIQSKLMRRERLPKSSSYSPLSSVLQQFVANG